jgi:mono/diheme cytochrome c family protein
MGSVAWTIGFLLGTAPIAALAQPAGGDQALDGMRLFNQSCRVCHAKPQLASPQYAPVLSMSTLGGKPDVIGDVIRNGTPRMPGFKYHFKPAEIDAIVAYIKTIPEPAAAPAPGKAKASGDAD